MTEKKPNPLGMLSDIAGALGGAVGEIVRDVRQDMKDMTPPAAKPATDTSHMASQVASASAGMAHVDVGGPGVAQGEDESPAVPMATGGTVNPWHDTAQPGKMCVDACFVAATDVDITRYAKALERELSRPFTLPLLVGEAGDDNVMKALQQVLKAEPRAFGAVGFGPRKVQEDIEAMDEALTGLLNANPKILAIGPVGLDEPYAPYALAQQVEQMVRQLEIAADFGLPVILAHNRSLAAMKAVLEGESNLPPLIWANPLENEDDIALVRKLDAYVLVRPEITYEEHRPARENLRRIMPERWLLASGSGLVAPESRKGHPGGPESLLPTLKKFAAILDQPLADLREKLNTNARRVLAGGA